MPDKNKFEAFNDGVACICKVSGRKITGDKGSVRFGIRTVGVQRYYEAKVASEKVDRVISVPYDKRIRQSDILLIEEEQFKITLIQEKRDTKPACLYLSLERIVTKYQEDKPEL
jgi:hypothetical protein